MNSFQKRLYFSLSYFGLWVSYFILARFLFMAYYADKLRDITWQTIAQIPLYGLKLDLSFSAYLAILPFLLVAFSVWLPELFVKRVIKGISIPLLFIVSFLMLFDMAIYGSWGVRLDSTPLMYLNTPKEMFSSVTTTQLLMGVSIWILLSMASIFVFNKVMSAKKFDWERGKIWEFPLLLLLTASLVLFMRGGLQTIPINQSNVYFSNKMFANHAAVNFAWNFMKSLGYKEYEMNNPFELLDKEDAKKRVAESLMPESIQVADSAQSEVKILNTDRPNVLLIIWESLTAKVVEPLGGKPHVTEQFNRLAKEGVLFTNLYANGDRSDKGLVAILSGYPSQPDKSIIKSPSKTRTLPMLPQKMANAGYKTSFYYGGDLNFGNMNTYLRVGGMQELIDGSAFSKDDWNSKWGAHDHVVFDRLLADLPNGSSGFFNTFFTLSSHEPFEFPSEPKFAGTDADAQFMSAHAYTDQSLGDFISEAKKRDWWANTLVVVIADHGHHLPTHEGAFNSPKKYHIPMLWLGGALAVKDTTIGTVASQVDLPYTLLGLLGIDNSDFKWSQNLLGADNEHFAHYVFNKGFGVVSSDGVVVYDYVSKENIMSNGKEADKWQNIGKAITQTAYQDFLERK